MNARRSWGVIGVTLAGVLSGCWGPALPSRASFSAPPAPVLRSQRFVGEELCRFESMLPPRENDSEWLLRLEGAGGKEVEVSLNRHSLHAIRALSPRRPATFLVWRTRVGTWSSDTGREEITEGWELAAVKEGERVVWRDGQCDLHLLLMRRGRLRPATTQELRAALSGWHVEYCHPGIELPFIGCGFAAGLALTSELSGYICRECEAAYAAQKK